MHHNLAGATNQMNQMNQMINILEINNDGRSKTVALVKSKRLIASSIYVTFFVILSTSSIYTIPCCAAATLKSATWTIEKILIFSK